MREKLANTPIAIQNNFGECYKLIVMNSNLGDFEISEKGLNLLKDNYKWKTFFHENDKRKITSFFKTKDRKNLIGENYKLSVGDCGRVHVYIKEEKNTTS